MLWLLNACYWCWLHSLDTLHGLKKLLVHQCRKKPKQNFLLPAVLICVDAEKRCLLTSWLASTFHGACHVVTVCGFRKQHEHRKTKCVGLLYIPSGFSAFKWIEKQTRAIQGSLTCPHECAVLATIGPRDESVVLRLNVWQILQAALADMERFFFFFQI